MLEITVKTLDSQNHSFTCEDDITVQGFKEHIADTVSVPVESQRLIYCGRVLQDDKKLNDYDVNGKVIHLVQRAPPQPASRSSSSDRQRSTNQGGWTLGSPRVQLSRGLHRNVYMGAMAVPTEVVENHGLPAPRLSNTLSNSRLVTARSMLNKASQLLDRMDDPTVPLHPTPPENSSSESPQQPQPSAPEEEQLFQGNLSDSFMQLDASRESAVQAAQQIAAAFTAAALINIRVSDGNNEERTSGGSSNSESEASQSNQSTQSQTQQQEPLPDDGQNLRDSEQQRQESERSERPETERSESERPDTSRSSNDNDDQNGASRRSAPVPRPPLMAELLDNLLSTQDRMRPYIERYRTLMSTDPALTATTGPESVAENQRIVDGVSESLHYLSHASHALSDIIVDMGQQPPRNLRCRPIIIQHSTILQAGIPIQVESHINLNRSTAPNNNNTSDEGNEATRPASPVQSPARTQQQATRSNNTSSQSTSPSASLLGTLLLPSNVEVSMELSPPTAMDFNSPSATEGSENDQGQTNNNNNNSNGMLGTSGNSLNRTPLALIREALRSVINESQSQAETSASTSINLPFVMDLGTPNSGQSTQARSNIGTHPTTSTQTRSTARPHVLHPQSSPLNMGMGMGHNLDFDPFLPCYSHHVRRTPNAANSASTSTSRSNRRNTSTASASHSRSQSASRASSASARTMPHVNFTVGGDVTSDFLENDSQLASGVGLAMTLGEILQGATNSGDVHISLIGGPNTNEIHLTPSNDIPLLELLRSFNIRAEELVDRSFLSELCLFLLRKLTVSNILQLGLGQIEPIVSIRRPLREFLEQSFPNESGLSLQKKILDQIIEQIISSHQPYIQILVSSQAETAGRRVDISATIEALLRTTLGDFIKALFCNDSDDAHYAERVKLIARRFEEQFSAVLQHILGGRSALESVVTQVFNRVTESTNPFFQQFMADMISARLRSFTSQNWTRPQEELSPLIVFVDETPSTSVSESAENQRKPEPEPQFRVPSTQYHNVSAQPTQSRSQKPQQKQGPSVKPQQKQEKESESTPMEVDKTELDLELSNAVESDPKDLANGEEIQETFPGSENLPSEWVPIIARDSVRQRRQVQVQNLQGGPIPFSDAYLSCMPSKRRKLIEQQKPQLLVTPTPANANAIAASVERLVRDGMVHSQVEEVEGAAHAVAAAPEVRSAFGQAIRDCLHPSRVQSQDFSNSRRFPNASRYFGGDGKDDSAGTTNGSNK